MKYKHITEEDLRIAVNNSYTLSDVCRTLGRPTNSGNIKTIRTKIIDYGIDFSHFLGRRNISNCGKVHRLNLDEILVENSSYKNTDRLKKRIIKAGLKNNKCEICGITLWNDSPISLQIHHKNGKSNDNRIENIMILCPNCHSQTDNYLSKNKVIK